MNTGRALSMEQRQRKISNILFLLGCIMLALTYPVGVSDNPPGIGLLLCGSFAVMVGLLMRIRNGGKRTPLQHALYWSPRALCIVFIVLVSLFAFDVFDERLGFWATLLAFGMHLIPSFLLLLLLVMSWRNEWIGGILFPVFGALYILWAWGKPFAAWFTLLFAAGPPVLTGILFLLNWRYRNVLRGKRVSDTSL